MHHAKLNPKLAQTSLMHHSGRFISVQPDLIWLELLCSGPEHVFDCCCANGSKTKTYCDSLKLVGAKPVCSVLQFSWCYLGTKGSVGFFHSCPDVSETGKKKIQHRDRDFLNCLKPVSTGKTGEIPDRSVLFIHLDQTK